MISEGNPSPWLTLKCWGFAFREVAVRPARAAAVRIARDVRGSASPGFHWTPFVLRVPVWTKCRVCIQSSVMEPRGTADFPYWDPIVGRRPLNSFGPSPSQSQAITKYSFCVVPVWRVQSPVNKEPLAITSHYQIQLVLFMYEGSRARFANTTKD